MKRLRFVNIWPIFVVFFALSQVFAASGEETSYLGDPSADYSDTALCPPPQVLGYDSTIYLCHIEQICFDVIAVNSGGDSLVITQVEGPGQFEMLTDTSGQTCFMPDEVDSATYLFAYTVYKAYDPVGCGEPPATPLCPQDTIRITVLLNRSPYVNMADDFSISLCQPETICFSATADDLDFDMEDIFVNYGYYDDITDRICFAVDTAGVYTLILTAVDSCGVTDSDTTIVTVAVNEDPTVDMGDDFTVYLCGEMEVCIDAIITDDNVETIYVNFGRYDNQTGQVCFIPDTAGSYVIVLTAIDACEVSAQDTVVVTVVGGEAPYVDLGEDFSVALCEPSEICVDVETIEIFKSLSTNLGQYDEYTDQVCFLPDTSGVYTLIVEVTDSCDFVGADTVNITVELNSPPVVRGMPDSTLYLCYPQEICLPVEVFDPDGDIEDISVNLNGRYVDGYVCFVPYDSGHYELIVTVTDSCGNVGADTAVVVIETDQEISLECPNDTTIFTCQLVDTFCLPISGIPENAEVEVWGINTWYDAQTKTICFWSECGNTNHITVHVTTPCNTYSCDFTVTVVCNTNPLVILPPDTVIAICEPVDICLPAGISDLDGNLWYVDVEGGYYDSATSKVCFTADTTGTYIIKVTAYDTCGATDQDQIAVHVVANSAPYISYELIDSVFSQCAPEEICIPIEVSDVDGNLDSVTTSLGFYDAQIGEVCFTPDSTGRYCLQIIAIDLCDLSDTAMICVIVETGNFVQIDCPPDPIDISLCNPGEVCWPLEITGDSFQVQTSYGTWEDGQLCFFADTSGLYNIEVIAIAECNSDTCYVTFDVVISEEVSITCPTDTTVVLCEPDTLCLTYSTSFNVDTVTVTPPAFLSGLEVCVPLLESGAYVITMTAEGQCGTDTCVFTVTAHFNSPPVVDAGDDTTFTLCELSEICVPFTVSDTDNNIVDTIVYVNGSPGLVNDGLTCFTPQDFGTYQVVIITVDECLASDSDTVVVTVEAGDSAFIFPIANQIDTICGPDTICVMPLIWPDDAQVTVSPPAYYDSPTGKICIGIIDEGGTYNITVIAEALCGSDTCEFTWEVELAQPPVITCPDRIDTVLCLVEPATLCYPVSVTGTISQIDVSPVGSYSNSQVCIPVDTAGIYEIEIAATGICGTDTCSTTIEVGQDQAPELFLPDYQVFERCPDDTDVICIDGIYAADIESLVSLTMTCGVGIFTLITSDSGEVCFLPDTFGVYEFCFEAFDSCSRTTGSFFVEIVEEETCDVCVRLSIDGGECTPVGVTKKVDMLIETNDPIGGFDILLSYDASVVSFQSATISGTQIDGWEYFTYRFGSPDCGSLCPSGLVRFIGLADMNDGAHHPPDSTLTPNGLFIVMQFLVANDQNLGGQFLPISFVWYDCGDNTFSDPTGNDLYMDLRIFNPETTLVWDELDDITYPESDRAYGVGAPDTCLEGGGYGKPGPIRCVEFINGGICVIHPESIDVRGDINLNGVPYEIADAVLFTNYFIYGLRVFKINMAGQIAATDINADGLTLSVADLVYLIRIIIGDADPMPKLTPYDEELSLSTDYDASVISITAEAVSDIGAALFLYDISGSLVVDEPHLAPDAEGMDLMYHVRNGQLRMLIYNIGTNRIPAGAHKLVEISHQGDGLLNLAHAEIVDYQGRPYAIAGKVFQRPTGFVLNQNYPNPFNPTTTISFTLPQAAEWNLKIYNITGGLVREYRGSNEAGTITVEWDGTAAEGIPAASGVYFYRLEAVGFTETRKMILLK